MSAFIDRRLRPYSVDVLPRPEDSRVVDYYAKVDRFEFSKSDPRYVIQDRDEADVVFPGWVIDGGREVPGIANLRAVSSDSSLLFGGSVSSAWHPAYPEPGSATLVRGNYSIRALGKWAYAGDDTSQAMWGLRKHDHRAGFIAVEAARATGLKASDMVKGLAAADEDTTRQCPNTWRCFWLVTSRVIFTKLGEHRVHQIVDYTFNSESGRWDRTSNA